MKQERGKPCIPQNLTDFKNRFENNADMLHYLFQVQYDTLNEFVIIAIT